MEKDGRSHKPEHRKHKTAFRKPDSYWNKIEKSTDPVVRALQISEGFRAKGEEELAENYELFAELHPELLKDGFEGKFAVIVQRRLICVSESTEEGLKHVQDQQITGKIVVRKIVCEEFIQLWPPNSRVETFNYRP